MTRATTVKPKPEEPKRRDNEKRKEKSRDAARCRRSRETEIFQDLASLLPMRQEDVQHLDKASVLRLTIAYLKVRNMLETVPTVNQKGDNIAEDGNAMCEDFALEKEKLALLSLDGFLLVLSADGDITYISENVGDYLGLSQIDMLGQPIWDYSHQCDHKELREALNGRHHSPSELLKGVASSDGKPIENRDLFLRLKCTLKSRGRSVNIKSASYKVIHVTGHITCQENGQRQLVAVARPLPHPSNIEVPLDSSTFLSKHSLDMKFSYVDDKMYTLLGYNPADLMGKSLYECLHGSDSDHLMGTFNNVISIGQSETARYRFLARSGGYAWVVTQPTLIYDKQKPHSIVCVNYVISDVEHKDEVYSCAQLEARQQKSVETEDQASVEAVNTCAASAAIVVKTSDKVLKDNNNIYNDLKEKLTPEKEAEQVIRNVPAPISINCVIRPASIFSSVKTPIAAAAATTVAVVEEKQLERKVPQSVTAQMFVKPKHATDKIFAPRTEAMNKEFLQFSEKEPDDLTQLAPTAGDACIPLEETGHCFKDVFDGFMIPDDYTSLLQDDLSSLYSSEHQLRSSSSISVASPIALHESTIAAIGTLTGAAMSQNLHHSPNSNSRHSSTSSSLSSSVSASAASLSSSASNWSSLTTAASDIGSTGSLIVSQINSTGSTASSGASNYPFINYRDEVTEFSHSPQHLLSPELLKSPEGSSIPSLINPNGSECPFMTLNMDDNDLTMSMRAPYILMNEVDHLPLLTSDDLMWGAPAAPVDSALQQQQLSPQANVTSVSGVKSTPPLVTGTARIANLNSNTENNCNIGNKAIDSSLAALLCGRNVINVQLQQQQQQQQQQSLNSNRHILVHHQQQPQHQVIAAAASNFKHPMVVNTPNFNKNSNTVETWSMNELLQLNEWPHNTSTNGTTTLPIAPGQTLNGVTSIISKTNTSLGAISRKRPLTESADRSSKRVKPNPTITINQQQYPRSSPQLLQQLMAPSPVPAKVKAKSKSLLDQTEQHRWPPTGKVNLHGSGYDTNIPGFSPNRMIVEDPAMYDPNEFIKNRIPIWAKPVLGSTTTAAAASTGQLTIQTEDVTPEGRADDDFMMTVSPSLLTPSDLEIWHAIMQGLDPDMILTPGSLNYEMTIPGNEIMQNNLI